MSGYIAPSIVLQKVAVSPFTAPSALRGEQLKAAGWCQLKTQVQPKDKWFSKRREKQMEKQNKNPKPNNSFWRKF